MNRLIAPIIVVALSTSCGILPQKSEDDSSPATGVGQQPTNSSMAIQSKTEMPPCDEGRDQQLIYVVSEETFFTCTESAWVQVKIEGQKGDAGTKGDQGTAGDKGEKGLPGETFDTFAASLAIYKDYRQSIVKLTVTCDCGATTAMSAGSGFFCAENTICTNSHVVDCRVTDSSCTTTRIQAQVVHDTIDSVNPDNTPVPFFLDIGADFDLHNTRDLAKVSVSSMPTGAKVLDMTTTPIVQSDLTLRSVVSMSFPLGFKDLYTDLGHVNTNGLDDNGSYNPVGSGLDFSTTNDTDKGSSGSPIIDARSGKVIGVLTAGTSEENANFSWAIDADYLNDF